jgi:hypothetical protein
MSFGAKHTHGNDKKYLILNFHHKNVKITIQGSYNCRSVVQQENLFCDFCLQIFVTGQTRILAQQECELALEMQFLNPKLH